MERLTEAHGPDHFRVCGNQTVYNRNPGKRSRISYALAKLFYLEHEEKKAGMTNAEKIRSMTDRELAELIVSGEWSAICPMCKYNHTGQCKFDEDGNEVGDGETCMMGALEWLTGPAGHKTKV